MVEVTLKAVRLGKRFGVRQAVEDVSFTACSGDVVGLLGPNGAGKTTTIRLLSTVLERTSGDFWVAGHPSSAPAEIRRRVGVLPESIGYPGHQTGREHLRFSARLYGLSRHAAGEATDRVLAEVGLDERADSVIAGYSRGMRQRLGIGRALVHDPSVVFLDEPTLGLDPAGQSQVLALVRDIARRRGATVVLSTHTLPEVEQVCTTVLILDRGRVLLSGTVGEVIARAGVERSAQLRVPHHQVLQARQVLGQVPGLVAEPVEGRPDVLRIGQGSTGHRSAGRGDVLNAALVAVAEIGVAVLSFEVEGARLSDAFLKVTADQAP